ncbi:MAG: LPS export ABC transporter periplasmic protein LptC [Bacteroidales bacterium]
MINYTKRIALMRCLQLIVCLFVFVGMLVLPACSKPKNEIVESFSDKLEMPSLHSEDVSTLISDSGVTKYRITTAQWDMFEKGQEPKWYFPKGIFVEKFDSLYQTEASIKGDTAYFYKNKKLWHLINNVEIFNQAGDRFETDELFWDQRKQQIYSDKFIHIERADVIIEGYGFESNESMTKYTIRTPSGIFPVQSVRPAADSLKTDSLKTDSIKIKEGDNP